MSSPHSPDEESESQTGEIDSGWSFSERRRHLEGLLKLRCLGSSLSLRFSGSGVGPDNWSFNKFLSDTGAAAQRPESEDH